MVMKAHMHIDAPIQRARRLSLTSLIDVIFLLLLFFMLTSTFTRFAELDLAAVEPGAGVSAAPQIIIRLSEPDWIVNGRTFSAGNAIAELQRLETRGAKRAVVLVTQHTTTQALLTALEHINHETAIATRVSRQATP